MAVAPLHLPIRPLPGVAHANQLPIDVDAENAASLARLRLRHAQSPDAPIIVVPGYTPLGATAPIRLHANARARLVHAVKAKAETGALAILVSGGNVYPEHTPFNEAWEMRAALVSELHVDAAEVLLEPYARHSTTNLRNAGRFLSGHGLRSAIVVTDFGQGFYFGAQGISTFELRCKNELGYVVGKLEPNLTFTRIRYTPSEAVWTRGSDPKDP